MLSSWTFLPLGALLTSRDSIEPYGGCELISGHLLLRGQMNDGRGSLHPELANLDQNVQEVPTKALQRVPTDRPNPVLPQVGVSIKLVLVGFIY